MKPERIRDLLTYRADKASKHFLAVSPAFDEDVIHRFRVEVKRLRALMRIVNDVTECRLKLPKTFRHIYHISGAIRDTQILMKLITNTWKAPLPVFYEHLSASLNQLKTAWECHYDPGMIKRFIKKADKEITCGIAPGDIAGVFEDNIVKIMQMDHTATDEMLHKTRKRIKNMLYLTGSERHNPAAFELPEAVRMDKLEAIAGLLGDYNDDKNVFGRLDRFRSPAMLKEERDAIAALCREGAVHLARQRAHIIDLLGDFSAVQRASPR